METQLLKDPMAKPDSEILEAALGKKYSLFMEFEKKIAEQNLIPEWNYYNDGKSWLCKILHKKKNLCWLSVWNTGYKITFYFPEKAINGFYELDINDEIKIKAKEAKPAGKSHPVQILIKTKQTISDVLKILEYKRKF